LCFGEAGEVVGEFDVGLELSLDLGFLKYLEMLSFFVAGFDVAVPLVEDRARFEVSLLALLSIDSFAVRFLDILALLLLDDIIPNN
jgi:hypothetical protein